MDKLKLSENIKRIRRAAGMTQKQVADACGMFDSAIRQYESGKKAPKIDTLEKIALALDVSPIELLDGAVWQIDSNACIVSRKQLAKAIKEYFDGFESIIAEATEALRRDLEAAVERSVSDE